VECVRGALCDVRMLVCNTEQLHHEPFSATNTTRERMFTKMYGEKKRITKQMP